MKDCEYPKCQNCTKDDCNMDLKDIQALLKRRRYNSNPELHRQRQQAYRNRIRANLPHCDGCKNCILVQKDKGDGFRRLCIDEMRLIEQKVANSPQWCKLRKGGGSLKCQNVEV